MGDGAGVCAGVSLDVLFDGLAESSEGFASFGIEDAPGDGETFGAVESGDASGKGEALADRSFALSDTFCGAASDTGWLGLLLIHAPSPHSSESANIMAVSFFNANHSFI